MTFNRGNRSVTLTRTNGVEEEISYNAEGEEVLIEKSSIKKLYVLPSSYYKHNSSSSMTTIFGQRIGEINDIIFFEATVFDEEGRALKKCRTCGKNAQEANLLTLLILDIEDIVFDKIEINDVQKIYDV